MGSWDILVIAFGTMIGWGWVINSGDWIQTGGFMGSIIAVAGILLIVASGVSGDAANITDQFWNAGSGTTASSVFKVACMTPFLFVGFDVIPQAAEEINVPYKKLEKSCCFPLSWQSYGICLLSLRYLT